ncbi:MAG: CARDB domain-containing protein, partial [bacterium]|nr:CARDB domain-containing protein [bacterium]
MLKNLNAKAWGLGLGLIILVAAFSGLWESAAQDSPEATQIVADPVVTGIEPSQVSNTQSTIVTIYGNDFSQQTGVTISGIGLVERTLVSANVITITVPAGLAPGVYEIRVGNSVTTYQTVPLLVVAPPPPAPAPTNTFEPPPTLAPATPIPGRPNLLVRNFTANPSVTTPGGSVLLTFEVVNQGNRAAQGVSVSVNPEADFVPANGQATALLPDVAPGGTTTVSLTVITSSEAEDGAASIPISLAYRDFSGETYTSSSALGITVDAEEAMSQVTLARYMLDPNPVIPGEAVRLTVLLTNSGNETATQALLRVAGEDSILLPGPQGDSFPLGDIAPGANVGVEVPLIVANDAETGPQSQPITIEYLRGGEIQRFTSSLTVQVASVIAPRPLMLLQRYDVGTDTLKPGDRFMLALTLQNVGQVGATNLLVTFGTVESTGGSSGGDNGGGNPNPASPPGGGTGSTGGGTTSTTPSTTFAPLGTGGTVF